MKHNTTHTLFIFIVLTLLSACTTPPDPTPPNDNTKLVTRTSPPVKNLTFTEAKNPLELTTDAGAKLKIAQGWWIAKDDGIVYIKDPERQLNLWIVENQENDTGVAIQKAWQLVAPGFKRTAENEITPPPTGGWDKLHVITYKTQPEESLGIQAIVQRKGNTNYIALVHTPIAIAQRRGAQLQQIFSSLTPKDLKEESFKDATAKTWTDDHAQKLDSFIQRAQRELGVPGLAIAVLQGGKTVFERGYGVTQKGGKPIQPTTKFMIGSNSKSFTSLMMARLVDQKKLSWDTPMTKLMPSFRTGDTQLTKKILAHHTMCACTGLPRQDLEFIFEFNNSTPEQRLKELSTMKPTTGFLETFQYSNPLVSAGGYAAAKTLHKRKSYSQAYQLALRDLILKPLGLSSTSVHNGKAPTGPHAIPHGMDLMRTYNPIPFSYENAVSSVAPAGGLWSNVRDLATVMRMELMEGKNPKTGQTFVSKENLLRRRQPSIQIGKDSHYGLALMVSNSKGLHKVGHGGNTLGFTTLNDFYPQHNLGIIILANAQSANLLTGSIQRKILELLFEEAETKAEKNFDFSIQAAQKRLDTIKPRLSKNPDPNWINPLLGTYTNPALGSATLKRDKDSIIFDTDEWTTTVSVYEDNGSKMLMLDGAPVAGLPFIPKPDGSLLLDVGQQKYTFKKK